MSVAGLTGGLVAVIRREWRGRRISFDIFYALALFGTLLVSTHLLGDALLRGLTESGDRVGTILRRWMITSTLTLGVLLPASGSMLGAAAVYTREERHAVEAYLLASIPIHAIFLGKFIVGLRPSLSLWMLWNLFWILVQILFHHPLGIKTEDFLWTSICLLISLVSFSSLATAGASSRKFRSYWLRGSLVSLSCLFLVVSDVLLAEHRISLENNPVQLIQNLLTINPIAVLCKPLHFDLFRTDWLYAHSSVAEFGYHYPSPALYCMLYGLAGLISLAYSTVILKRALR